MLLREKFSFVALIPARLGSKSVKNKNFKKICGKPLIDYTIEVSLKSKLLKNNVFISTNNKKIKSVTDKYKIGFVHRPNKLCADNTLMLDVIKHFKNYLNQFQKNFTHLVLLQPTCPTRTYKQIDQAIKLVKNKNDTVVSVSKVGDVHPARMYKMKNKELIPLNKNLNSANRQDLPEFFHRNGYIYIFPLKNILNKNSLYSKKIIPYIMSSNNIINIDTLNDWHYAEYLLSRTKNFSK